MVNVSDKKMGTNQAYEARGVVARFSPMGFFQPASVLGKGLKVPVYRFLTLYQGEGREAIPVEYNRPAPVLPGDHGETFLNIEALEVGDFVVDPGLVYRRCLWFDNLMAAHMKALQTYRVKDKLVAEKDDAAPIDIGTIDATTDQVTKQ